MAATLFERQMAMYTTFHRDHRNRLTHFFGIPAIIVSLMVALALVRLGPGPAISLAGIVAVAAWALWIVLDLRIGLTMGMFMIPSLALAEWIVATNTVATVWIVFAVLFVGGWALQLWGHVYEGRRPALMSNLFQALIGPMFLVAEIFFAMGLRQDLKDRVEQVIRETWPQYADRAAHPAG
jgi:uncharacterized membrane protein YGL010W